MNTATDSLKADGDGKHTGSFLPSLRKWRVVGITLLLPVCLILAASLFAAEKPAGKPAAAMRAVRVAPLLEGESATSLHTPFADGDCSLCHQSADPKAPGPLQKAVNETCLDCHDDFSRVKESKVKHAAAKESCNNCHNPHNAKYEKLLVNDVGSLCLSCHADMKSVTTEAKVKHDATIKDKACINCHNSHGADVEHLLISLPFDLCITCHGENKVVDGSGRQLTNFKKLLADNPEHHGPAAEKDCSACHNPHGAEYFRLLSQEYPSRFYAPYNPESYALCFECHEKSVFEEPRTKTLTLFRNGEVNLHYLHVNKSQRGRTCRACHEVHAAGQTHQIRDGVPYGSKGWILKINYTATASGGTCAKTCHDIKSYSNRKMDLTANAKGGR